MEHPVQEWQDCAHEQWKRLNTSAREKFSTNANLEEIFLICLSELQLEDEEILDRLSREQSTSKEPSAVQFYKEEANKRFGRRQYLAAAVLYSKALSHAHSDTEAMATCFANRSAVLFYLEQYSDCLKDIERAQEHGCPERLNSKILHRQAECLQKLRRPYPSAGLTMADQEPKIHALGDKLKELNLNHNPQMTNASRSLSLQFSTSKGRHLVAAQDIAQGEVLIWEEAFVSVIIPAKRLLPESSSWDTRVTNCDLYCHHCLGRVLASLPCQHCSHAKYCSRTCMDSAWRSYHSTECSLGGLLHALGVFCQTALRAVLVAGCDQVSELIQQTNSASAGDQSSDGKGTNEQKYSSSYESVFKLLPHTENHKGELKFLCGYSAAALCKKLSFDLLGEAMTATSPSKKLVTNVTGTKQDWTSLMHSIGQAILRHMLQLYSNAQAVTILQEENDDPPSIETSKNARLATAVFPVMSLLNHACDPNTSVSFSGRCVMVRANQPIKNGEEVLHCYGPHKVRMGIEDRQHYLQEQYFFTCQCEDCIKELESLNRAISDFSCPKCKSSLEGGEELLCGKGCGSAIKRDKLLGQLQCLKDIVDTAKQHLHDEQRDEAIGMLMSCLSDAEKFLSVNHKLIGEISDHLAQAEASKGNWTAAAVHLKRSIQTVEKRFGAFSIELGHELFKLAQILFNGRDVADSLSTIQRAEQLFIVHYGADYNLVEELREMKTCLLQLPGIK